MVDEISIHFMVAGHTKFSCDRMFGVISQILKNNRLIGLLQIISLINQKMRQSKSYNARMMTRSMWRKYKEYSIQHVGSIVQITSYHHIRIKKENLSVIIEAKQKVEEKFKKINFKYNKPLPSFMWPPKMDIKQLNKKLISDLNQLSKYKEYKDWKLDDIE